MEAEEGAFQFITYDLSSRSLQRRLRRFCPPRKVTRQQLNLCDSLLELIFVKREDARGLTNLIWLVRAELSRALIGWDPRLSSNPPSPQKLQVPTHFFLPQLWVFSLPPFQIIQCLWGCSRVSYLWCTEGNLMFLSGFTTLSRRRGKRMKI